MKLLPAHLSIHPSVCPSIYLTSPPLPRSNPAGGLWDAVLVETREMVGAGLQEVLLVLAMLPHACRCFQADTLANTKSLIFHRL